MARIESIKTEMSFHTSRALPKVKPGVAEPGDGTIPPEPDRTLKTAETRRLNESSRDGRSLIGTA